MPPGDATHPGFAEVIVPLPVPGRFTYAIPEPLRGRVEIGHRVLVRFGPRRITGFVRGLHAAPPEGLEATPRPIEARLDEQPMLPLDLLELIGFASDYYLAPEGEVLRVALPPGLASASEIRLRPTEAGRRALEEGSVKPGPERSLLEATARSGGAKRTAAVRRVAERLIARGLIEARDAFSAKDAPRTVEVARRAGEPQAERAASPRRAESGGPRPPSGRHRSDPEAALRRAPARRRVFEALAAGPTPVSALVGAEGGAAARRALRALVADGLVVIERQPESQAARAPTERAGPDPTPEQAAALASLEAALGAGTSRGFLLRGVTGSGKTEVYLRLIAAARAAGRGAIVLVPEIALTSQLEARFSARFGDDVVVLHSAMTDVERRDGWSRLERGLAGIALGPRSAVWAPVRRLGVVVVDEEHDPSFKQNADVRYHGRDLAMVRAHRAEAVLVLGSATPSLESRRHVETGRLEELRLAARVHGRALPEVHIVDLGTLRRDVHGELPLLSPELVDALLETVGRGEQAIVFLNRRGFNTVVVCESCTAPRRCPVCDVSLTFHRSAARMLCHYCGHGEPLVHPCAQCGEAAMVPYGAGTERIASLVQEAVVDARVGRLDRDVTARVGALEDVLDRFRRGELDVLVGTQMVAKGHDFPRVTLVGIVCADSALSFPDFRAAERTFQILTQVAGRAGRAERPGRVIVQSFQPQHYALRCAVEHDDDRFWALERESRAQAGYPPFGRIGVVRVESEDLAAVEATARELAERAREAAPPEVVVQGPVPAPIERIRGRFRRMIMVRAPTPARLVATLRAVQRGPSRTPAGVDVVYDVDAGDLL